MVGNWPGLEGSGQFCRLNPFRPQTFCWPVATLTQRPCAGSSGCRGSIACCGHLCTWSSWGGFGPFDTSCPRRGCWLCQRWLHGGI